MKAPASRDALGLQSELAYLGASLSTTADWDRITRQPQGAGARAARRARAHGGCRATARPSAPKKCAASVTSGLTGLLQARDQPNTSRDSRSTRRSSRPRTRTRATRSATASPSPLTTRRPCGGSTKARCDPDRATLFVVGDVNEAQVRTLMTQTLRRPGARRERRIALPAAPAACVRPGDHPRVARRQA